MGMTAHRLVRVSFSALNITALVAALLYLSRDGSVSLPRVPGRTDASCVSARSECPARTSPAKTRAKARREAAGRAAAQRRATARRRARLAAANAWHRGYAAYKPADGIYYRWVRKSCSSHVDRCWHIKVIARNGCGVLVVQGNEAYHGTSLGDLIGSKAHVPSKTPALLELIGTSGSTRTAASAPTISCY